MNKNLNSDSNKKVNNKMKYLIPLFVILLIVCVSGIIILCLNSSGSKKSSPTNNSKEQELQENDTNDENDDYNDVLGYSILVYSQDDGSGKSHYKIVELHKKEENKDIVSYEGVTQNATGEVNKLDSYTALIVDNKLYYQLHFNLDEYGINTYSNFMCIDLSVDNPVPFEILSTKDFSNEKRRIVNYKVLGDYLYYLTLESEDSYYKYSMIDNKEEQSSKNEFDSIRLFSDSDYQYFPSDSDMKQYIKGKELYVNDHRKIIYDGEIIYTAKESNVVLYYPINDNIVFSETQKCESSNCILLKYYKLNLDTREKEEIDYNTNKIYSQVIWYKK